MEKKTGDDIDDDKYDDAVHEDGDNEIDDEEYVIDDSGRVCCWHSLITWTAMAALRT